jgi:hypothetical protein
LRSVDLPTFGRPIMATKPDLKPGLFSMVRFYHRKNLTSTNKICYNIRSSIRLNAQ